MSRARIEGDALVCEDQNSHRRLEFFDDNGDLVIDNEGARIVIRASDAASIGDWLRRTFAGADWRVGVDPAHTSIPIGASPP